MTSFEKIRRKTQVLRSYLDERQLRVWAALEAESLGTLGKAIPYGVYDITANRGWVSVGREDHDTAEFAVQTIRRWWALMGSKRYPNAKRILALNRFKGGIGSRGRVPERPDVLG